MKEHFDQLENKNRNTQSFIMNYPSSKNYRSIIKSSVRQKQSRPTQFNLIPLSNSRKALVTADEQLEKEQSEMTETKQEVESKDGLELMEERRGSTTQASWVKIANLDPVNIKVEGGIRPNKSVYS